MRTGTSRNNSGRVVQPFRSSPSMKTRNAPKYIPHPVQVSFRCDALWHKVHAFLPLPTIYTCTFYTCELRGKLRSDCLCSAACVFGAASSVLFCLVKVSFAGRHGCQWPSCLLGCPLGPSVIFFLSSLQADFIILLFRNALALRSLSFARYVFPFRHCNSSCLLQMP